MPFRAVNNGHGRSKFIIENEPDFIVSLEIAPVVREEILKRGIWLIAVMSVYSFYDYEACLRAIAVAKRASGRYRLGLRPYDYPEEFLAWLPEIATAPIPAPTSTSSNDEGNVMYLSLSQNPHSSPVWVAIKEGVVLDIAYGRLTHEEIEKFAASLQ